MDIQPDTEKKIQQLQIFEQNLQALQTQRQNPPIQMSEMDSALQELDRTSKAYRIVSTIMVSADIPELKKDLESKKEIIQLRIKSLEKQESSTKERATALQDEVLKSMKAGKERG